jgi:hypothetical protein
VDEGERQGKGDGKMSGHGSSCCVENGGNVNFCLRKNGSRRVR